MTRRSKSKAELEAELRFVKQSKIAEGLIQIANNLIRHGTILGVSYYIYLTVESLSGKTTLADIGISFLGNLNVSVAIAWSSCIVGIVYGLNQKKLKNDTVERLQSRITGLEKEIDPKRSSSNLTRRGETRQEDKL